MTTDYTEYSHLLSQFSDFLSQQLGIFFPQERLADLSRGMNAVSSEFGFQDTEKCMQWLLLAPLNSRQIEVLSDHLTVGETYFFRERAVFNALQQHIFPKLIESRRQTGKYLRIWSAGCSTGEEPYSLAILVQQMIPDFKQWNILILGTDINARALKKASSGIYSNWSFRDAPAGFRDRYFHARADGKFEILPHVRDMVTFRYLNLADDAHASIPIYTNAIDIIFCRNILMYFEAKLATKVINRHYDALTERGWLIVSPSEMSQASSKQFSMTYFPDAILHQKVSSQVLQTPQPTAYLSTSNADRSDDTYVTSRQKTKRSLSAGMFTKAMGLKKTDEQLLDIQDAVLSCSKGHFEEAIKEISGLLTVNPNSIEAITLMLRIYASQSNFSLASSWYEKLISIDRLNALAHYLMATVFLELKQLEEAVRLFKLTLYLDQTFVLAHFALGNIYRQQGEGQNAKRYFDNVLKLLEKYPHEHVIPESDGATAGRLTEIIQSFMIERESIS